MSDSAVAYLFPVRVRTDVLAQHGELRRLLESALATTTSGLLKKGAGITELSGSIRQLRLRFRAHLDFEERALLPILATDEKWGPQRTQALLDEHCRQRAELDTLIEGIAAGWDRQRLALTLRSLVVDLLRDMREEEFGLLDDALLTMPVITRRAAR
jgi:hypothetical protein